MAETPWQHLLDQAARCLEQDDELGAEVHLTAAREVARSNGDRPHAARALIALGRLRVRQRRHAAAARLLREAAALGADELDLELELELERALEELRGAR